MDATTRAAKRQSLMPNAFQAGPKAPVHFSSSAIISDSAIIVGHYPITVSTESVISPRARLDSGVGPVNVGRRCIVYERTALGNSAGVEGAEGSVTLGDFVTVETGAIIEPGGTSVSDGSVVGVGCKVGRGAVVGKHCVLTAHTVVAPGEKISDYTVILGNGTRRQRQPTGAPELRNKGQARQIEVLKKLIPSNPTKFQ